MENSSKRFEGIDFESLFCCIKEKSDFLKTKGIFFGFDIPDLKIGFKKEIEKNNNCILINYFEMSEYKNTSKNELKPSYVVKIEKNEISIQHEFMGEKSEFIFTPFEICREVSTYSPNPWDTDNTSYYTFSLFDLFSNKNLSSINDKKIVLKNYFEVLSKFWDKGSMESFYKKYFESEIKDRDDLTSKKISEYNAHIEEEKKSNIQDKKKYVEMSNGVISLINGDDVFSK